MAHTFANLLTHLLPKPSPRGAGAGGTMAGEGCFRSGDFTSPPWRGKPGLTRRYRAARVGTLVAQPAAVAVCGSCSRPGAPRIRPAGRDVCGLQIPAPPVAQRCPAGRDYSAVLSLKPKPAELKNNSAPPAQRLIFLSAGTRIVACALGDSFVPPKAGRVPPCGIAPLAIYAGTNSRAQKPTA